MNLASLFENPKRMRIVRWLFYLTMLLIVAADFLIHRHHILFFWDAIPGFSALFGLASCILIIVVSKILGHRGLMKREDYYD